MILTREQINRYMRHIIMTEISGPGQKKLVESSVFVCGESVSDVSPAIYYLAASGIGSIACRLADETGFDKLVANVQDLNQEVALALADGQNSQFRIYLGGPQFIKMCNAEFTAFAPSIVSLHQGWRGGQQVFKDQAALQQFLDKLPVFKPSVPLAAYQRSGQGRILSTSFLGALSVLEVIKLILGLGEAAADFLYCNLLTMDFDLIKKDALARVLPELYAEETALCEEEKLSNSKILIVGTGGLGSPAAYALARAGVGTLGLVDYDAVEISNLNRQILHATSRIGMPKVESAALSLQEIQPGISIHKYNTALTKENIFTILKDYDLVIAAVDNFPDRFLINDACFFARKPMLDAGVLRFDGTCMTMVTPENHCYRCTLPTIPAAGSTPSCAESGVLGPLPGIMGFLQAAEAVKLVSGQGIPLYDRAVFLDGLYSHFGTIKLAKQSGCPLCGDKPTIRQLQEYHVACTDAGSL